MAMITRAAALLAAAFVVAAMPARAQNTPAGLLALRQSVDRHDWVRANADLSARRDAAHADVRREREYLLAFELFRTHDTTVAAHLDAWVAASPALSFPLVARAEYRLGRAWQARGHGYAKEVKAEGFREMERWLRLAAADAHVAARLDSSDPAAFSPMLAIAQLVGNDSLTAEILQRGLARSPASLVLRQAYMGTLRPRWGGSTEAMDQFAASAQEFLPLNPELAALRGFALADSAAVLALDDQAEAALALLAQALAFGDLAQYRLDRAELLTSAEQYERALADLNRAILLRPGDAEQLAYRAGVLAHVAHEATDERLRAQMMRRAQEDLRIADGLDHGSKDVEWARATLAWAQR